MKNLLERALEELDMQNHIRRQITITPADHIEGIRKAVRLLITYLQQRDGNPPATSS
jgi:hypothetical protein